MKPHRGQNLHIVRVPCIPFEADPPLIVDADTPLPCMIPAQLLSSLDDSMQLTLPC